MEERIELTKILQKFLENLQRAFGHNVPTKLSLTLPARIYDIFVLNEVEPILGRYGSDEDVSRDLKYIVGNLSVDIKRGKDICSCCGQEVKR